jgi:hypothetical protein
MAEASDDPIIAALLRERDGYVLAGRTDRAAQVDEQLAAYGYTDPKRSPPKGRSRRRRETT